MGQLPRWAAHARWCLSAGGDFAARAAGGAPGARRLRPRCLRWAEAVSHARRAGRATRPMWIEEQTLRGAESMSDERTMGWKGLTHDWRSPIRHGAPVCDGHLPVTLSPVALDTSAQECAAGWNFARDAATALRIAGLWYRGRPARLLAVSDAPDAIDRSNKTRDSQITLARGATQEEWTDAATQLHAPIAMYAPGIVSEVGAWYVALGRPQHDTQRVVVELRRALAARGLSWTLQAYPNVLAASAAWAASDARAAR